MKSTTFIRAAVLAASTVALGFAGMTPAFAGNDTQSGPDTPATTSQLPIVHTTRSGPLQANILNPRPVCNSWSEHRTIIYRTTTKFTPIGTIQATNYNKVESIPLTQTLSKTQTLTLQVSGDIGGSFSGVQAAIHPSISYSISWSAGQQIGPYQVKPQHTAYATYGFETIKFAGTQQSCKADGTWSDPWPYTGEAPLAAAVRFQEVAPGTNPLPGLNQDPSNPNGNVPNPDNIPGDPVVAPGPVNPQLDLATSFQTSALKAPGFMGVVDLRVKNVGTQAYYSYDKPAMFRVSIKTEKGPLGVDRPISVRPMRGATAYDLGFDRDKSVRTWIVSLSNPVYLKEDLAIASFSFGDGGTREGRLVQSMEVTQVGRLAGDNSVANDTHISSTVATKSDTGRALPGLF